MTSQLKQRIVGIVVLVFLALIIVPWLFGSNKHAVFEEKSKPRDDSAASLPEQVKEVQNTKPVPDIPASTNTMEKDVLIDNHEEQLSSITKKEPELRINKDVENKKEIKPHETVARIKEMNATKISTIENNIVHHSPNSTKKITSHKVVKEPDLALKEPDFAKLKLSNTKSSKNSQDPSLKNWNIQLGSFNNKENADKLVKQLKAKGYPAYFKTSKNTKGNTITRVFVGPESERSTAEMLIKKIAKTHKLHGVIVKPNV